MENRPTSKGDSYFIIDDSVNQETESLLTVDTKSIFSPKPSNVNTPTLGDCRDPLTQKNVSEVLESKSNNAEHQFHSSLLLLYLIICLRKLFP